MIIDCRFAPEFEAGHIRGAVNISDPQTLERELLSRDRTLELLAANTVLVFHCEFT